MKKLVILFLLWPLAVFGDGTGNLQVSQFSQTLLKQDTSAEWLALLGGIAGIPLLTADNTFTGNNTFTGITSFTGDTVFTGPLNVFTGANTFSGPSTFTGPLYAYGGGNVSLTNMVNTAYSDTNALTYANLAGITDLNARARLVAMQNEINSNGLASQVVDILPLWTWLTPLLTSNSYYGRPVTYSNVFTGNLGMVFTNSVVILDGLPNCVTNTIFVTFSYSRPIKFSGTPTFLAGAMNPATTSGTFLSSSEGSFMQLYQRFGSTTWPLSNSGFSNLVNEVDFSNGWGYGHNALRQGETMRYALSSDGHGNMTAWYEGVQGKIGLATLNWATNSSVTNTDALTELRLGEDDTTNFYEDFNYNGQIMDVAILNTYATSNSVRGMWRALRELDPRTTDLFALDDSRGLPNAPLGGSLTTVQTNSFPYWQQQKFGPQTALRNLSVGGTHLSTMVGTFASNVLFSVGEPVNIQKIITSEGGINDIGASAQTAAQVFANVTNLALECLYNNAPFYYVCPWQNWTNSSVYPQTGTESNTIVLLANLLQTNPVPGIAAVSFPTFYVTQNMLNSNLWNSLDGTHFTGTNGWQANFDMAQLLWNIAPSVNYDGLAVATNFFGTYNGNFTGTFTPAAGANFISTNGAGANGNVGIQTNSVGPHGYILSFTNGLFIQSVTY